jgi:hypothetical protein
LAFAIPAHLSCSIIETSRDDALSRARQANYGRGVWRKYGI